MRTSAGADARSKKVALTAKSKRVVDRLAAEWRATEAAVAELEGEIPYPLSRVVTDIQAVLHRKSFHDRIARKARSGRRMAVRPALRRVMPLGG